MNDEFRKQALQKQVKGKFKGKQTLPSRVKPIYPEGAERDFAQTPRLGQFPGQEVRPGQRDGQPEGREERMV